METGEKDVKFAQKQSADSAGAAFRKRPAGRLEHCKIRNAEKLELNWDVIISTF